MKCGWLYQHVSIDSYGKFRPCCGWRNTGNEDKVTTVDDYMLSDFRKSIMDTMHQDKWPAGCLDCQEDESLDNYSMRTHPATLGRYSNPLYTDAEVKFGNLCNLGCVMCAPDNSSLIEQEWKKLSGQHPIFSQTFTPASTVPWFTDKEKLQTIARELSTRNQIRFTGGEPTVNNYLIDFLEEVQKHNTDITIKLTTNGNNWPKKLHELLKKFKTVISVSIDAYGEKNEYIRWPSKWSKIEHNINRMQELPNTTLLCGTTVGSYNLHLIPELSEWVQKVGFHEHNLDTIFEPFHLRPQHASDQAKETYLEFAQKYLPAQRVIKNIQQPGEGMKQTIDFLKILDYNRKVNYKVLEL